MTRRLNRTAVLDYLRRSTKYAGTCFTADLAADWVSLDTELEKEKDAHEVEKRVSLRHQIKRDETWQENLKLKADLEKVCAEFASAQAGYKGHLDWWEKKHADGSRTFGELTRRAEAAEASANRLAQEVTELINGGEPAVIGFWQRQIVLEKDRLEKHRKALDLTLQVLEELGESDNEIMLAFQRAKAQVEALLAGRDYVEGEELQG